MSRRRAHTTNRWGDICPECRGYKSPGSKRCWSCRYGDVKGRLLSKVDTTEPDQCWIWQEHLSPGGYGVFTLRRKERPAHRVAYELLVGPIPEGLTLDHLCRTRACVNPAHLEPVTMRENTMRSPIAPAAINARKTHCIRNHAFTPENTGSRKDGSGRICLTCAKLRARTGYLRRKALS